MTKSKSDALRRADRVLVGAFAGVFSFSAGVVFGHSAPQAQHVAPDTKPIVSAVVQTADGVGAIAPGTDKMPIRVVYTSGEVGTAMPAVASSESLSSPVPGSATSALAEEQEVVKILEDQRCLAEAMYYEARGEGTSGEEAIAEVVFHRMRAPGYPRSICGVVYEGAARGHGCQFSFACDGSMLQTKNSAAWGRARILAAKIIAGAVRLEDVTGDAISFHAADVLPDWADHLERTIQIGNHVFYRAASRVAHGDVATAQGTDGSF
jgi:hypothetical protein